MLKNLLILLIIIFIVAVIIYYFKLKNKHNKNYSQAHKKIQERKEMNKERIMKLFENKERITNNDVESSLLIADSTVTNYIDELEREGKIKQIGTEGRGVYYLKVEEEKKKRRNSI